MTDPTPDTPERPTAADKNSLLRGETIHVVTDESEPDSAGELADKFRKRDRGGMDTEGGATVTHLTGDKRQEILAQREARQRFIAEHNIIPTDATPAATGSIPEGGTEVVQLEARRDSSRKATQNRHGPHELGVAQSANKMSLHTEIAIGRRQVQIPIDKNRFLVLEDHCLDTLIKDHPALKEILAKNPTHIPVVDLYRNENGVIETRMGRIDAEHFDKSFMDVLHEDAHLKNEASSFRERLSGMSGTEKGLTALNAVLAGLFLFEAVQHFRHSREEDPATGERKTSWNNVTWGTVNAALSALSFGLVASALKSGPTR